MRKAMLIINPKSGNESGVNIQKVIVNHLENFFDEVIVKVTTCAEDLAIFGAEAADSKLDTVVIVGGDGTINGVLSGFVNHEYRPKIAIVPAGTGNLLATVLGISTIKRAAITSYEFNKTKKLNLGICNDKIFTLVASLGPVPNAIHDVSNERKTALGFLAYVFSSVEKLAKSETFDIKVTSADGEYTGSVDHLMMCLSDHIGIWRFTELGESVDQGKANLFILKNKSFSTRVAAVSSAITGKVEDSDAIECITTQEVTIDSTDGDVHYIDLDGEKGPRLPVTIKILKGHNEFYIPEKTILNTQTKAVKETPSITDGEDS